MKHKLVRLVVLAAVAAGALQASAQTFPSKPIRLVTQFAAGSGGDAGLRVMVGPMGDLLGQPIVIENRAGAGGVVAADLVARAAPDGHTLLAITPAVAVMRVFMGGTQFDPERAFQPVTQVTRSTTVIIAHPSFPANNARDLIEYARRNPGKVSFGTSGIGTEHHLSAEQIRMLTGVEMVHVPYKAGAQAMLDVVSGQLPVSYSITGPVVPLAKGGKVKIIAVVEPKRHPAFPDVQAIGEVAPGFRPLKGFTGLFTPAGIQPAVLKRLSDAAMKTLARPDIQAKMNEIGFETVGSPPGEFAETIREQISLVREIITAAKIQLKQ